MFIARSVHPLPGEAERKERLLALIDGFSSRRVLVVGDLIADEFIYGEVARVSREAPVLILKYDTTEMVAGGAGNAANNVAALGGRASLADSSAPMPRAAACWRAFTAASTAGMSCARGVPHAGQDAHPRRRHPLGQAAGRADRSRAGLAAAGGGEPRVPARSSRRRSTTAMPCCCPTTDRAS